MFHHKFFELVFGIFVQEIKCTDTRIVLRIDTQGMLRVFFQPYVFFEFFLGGNKFFVIKQLQGFAVDAGVVVKRDGSLRPEGQRGNGQQQGCKYCFHELQERILPRF